MALLNRETQGFLQKGRILEGTTDCRTWPGSFEAAVGDNLLDSLMIKVLIAEDNSVNRELLRELLELRGYTVLGSLRRSRSPSND